MSAELRGDLRNSNTDVVFDVALLALVVCAPVPQIHRLRMRTSTRGISGYYILFNVLFSNAQLSEALLCAAYAWPTAAKPVLKQINDGGLKGVRAFGGILGLLQIFTQWSGSIIVLLLFVAKERESNSSGGRLLAIASLHAMAILFPAIALALPKPSGHDFAKDILMALIDMSNCIVAPCFVVLQFYAQHREMLNQGGHPRTLSILSICLQAPVFTLLALRWFLRIGKPTWGNVAAPIWLWYQWAFPAVNYAIYALGCVFLLASYLWNAHLDIEYGDARARSPLLQ